MRRGITAGVKRSIFPRISDPGCLAAVRVPFCPCCFERANISGISDNDELYVPRNAANPEAPYPSPGSLLVEQTRAHHDGFFDHGKVCVYLASQLLAPKELAFRKEYRSSA